MKILRINLIVYYTATYVPTFFQALGKSPQSLGDKHPKLGERLPKALVISNRGFGQEPPTYG